MKTVIVDKDGNVAIREVGKPKIGPRQALTRTIANGICGTDITLIKGKFKGVPLDSYPILLGHENVGRVVEVGSQVKGLKVGDVVLLPFVDEDREHVGPYGSAWGGLSEYGVVTDAAAFEAGEADATALAQRVLPEDIDPVDAVIIVTLREVLSAIRYFGIRPEDPVVIYGAGPVGLTFIKLCKLLGVGPIISVVRNEARKANAEAFGADCVINSSAQNVRETVRDAFPNGVPFVIDAVGSPEVVNAAMGLIQDRGKICCYGVPKREDIHIDFSQADYNWVLAFQQMPRKDEEAAAHDQILSWIRSGELVLKDFISDYYPFDKVVEAYHDAMDKKILKKGVVVFS